MRSTGLAIVLIRSRISIGTIQISVTLKDLKLPDGPNLALFHRIRVRCRRKTIVRFKSVSKSTFDSL